MSGIKAGVGLTVAASQLPKLLGVPGDPDATGFFHVLNGVLRQVGDANGATVVLSIVSVAALLAMGRLVPRVPGPLIVVAAGIALIAFTGLRDRGVALIAEVPQGIPLPGVPSLHDVADLLPGALAISVMAFLETVAVARGCDGPRNLRSTVIANCWRAVLRRWRVRFFHSLPPAGGFSQTAVALRAGARTQLSGIVTAVLAVLVALFLAPVLSDLPQATLGAMWWSRRSGSSTSIVRAVLAGEPDRILDRGRDRRDRVDGRVVARGARRRSADPVPGSARTGSAAHLATDP